MPITAMIFDLDGTLVQTEKLKALSYAKAAVELCPFSITEETVIEAFKDFVGLSRQEVAEGLIERFELGHRAKQFMDDFAVETAWQAFVQVRLKYYRNLIEDPNVLRENQWSHNIELLKLARQVYCKIALATMSHREQVNRVLAILDLRKQFDFIATRDDVRQGKPDPEIYTLVAQNLAVTPEKCLVIEDSATGVQAAINAGMQVIAVSTPFTKEGLHKLSIIDKQYIIDNPVTDLLPAVKQLIEAHT
jgi:HAD superfamily hydrolase (TIGR01509 family)